MSRVTPGGIGSISVSGSDGAIVDGVTSSLKATVLDLTSANPLTAAIVDGNGDQITSFGGGTQYTEGDTDASITGTALMLEGAANALVAAPGTAADGLLVNLGTNNDVGLNAGTNAIGKLAANSGVDIGDVDVTSAIITGGAVADDASDSGNPIKVGGKYNSTMPTYTDGDRTQLQTTSKGSIKVTLMNNDSSVATTSFGIDQTTPGTTNLVALTAETTKVIGTIRIASGGVASGSFASGSIASGAIAAGAIAAGATSIADDEDVASAGADRLVKVAAIRLDTPVANDNVSASGDYTQFKLDNFGKLWVAGSVPEDTAHIDGESILRGGSRRIDTAATSVGSSGDWATQNQSAEGADWTTLTPTTTSGCSIFRSLDIDESEEDVKTSAGNVYGYYFGNVAASVRYLKFYNLTAANTTVGSSTPVLTFPLPASSSGHIAFPYPISFGTAICVACTTGVADADTGAPSANDVIINVFYK